LTFDQYGDVTIDFTADFSLDATSKTAAQISDDTFSYSLGVAFPTELTDYTLSFETQSMIESDQGCYVKITFPDEIDISSVDLTNIQGTGMLVDGDGAVNTFSDD